MEPTARLRDLIADIERMRAQVADGSHWIQLTYADQLSDPSISETRVTLQEWELEAEGVVTDGIPE